MESLPIVNKDFQFFVCRRRGFIFLALDGAAYHHIFFKSSLCFKLTFTDKHKKLKRNPANDVDPEMKNSGCEFCVLKRKGSVFVSEDGSNGHSLFFTNMIRVHMTFTDNEISHIQQVNQIPLIVQPQPNLNQISLIVQPQPTFHLLTSLAPEKKTLGGGTQSCTYGSSTAIQNEQNAVPKGKRSASISTQIGAKRKVENLDSAVKCSAQKKEGKITQQHEKRVAVKATHLLPPSSSNENQYFTSQSHVVSKTCTVLKQEQLALIAGRTISLPVLEEESYLMKKMKPARKIETHALSLMERDAQETSLTDAHVDETLTTEEEECKPSLEELELLLGKPIETAKESTTSCRPRRLKKNITLDEKLNKSFLMEKTKRTGKIETHALSLMEGDEHEKSLTDAHVDETLSVEKEECKPSLEELGLLLGKPIETAKESVCASNKSRQGTITGLCRPRRLKKIITVDEKLNKNPKLKPKPKNNLVKLRNNDRDRKRLNAPKEKKVRKNKHKCGNKPRGKQTKAQKCLTQPLKKIGKSKKRKQIKTEDSDSDYNPEDEDDEDDDINEDDENAPDVLVYRIKYPPKKPIRGIYPCDKCDKVYEYSKELRRHCRQMHPDIFSCDICEEVFKNITLLKCHMKAHQEVYTCNICEKRFKTATALVKHKRKMHNLIELSKFLCDKCGREIKSHTEHKCKLSEENTYPCKLCGKNGFKSPALVRQHWKEKHSNDLDEHGKKLIKPCLECDEVYLEEKKLLAHVRFHVPIECPQCGKMCKHIWGLKSHLLIHNKKTNIYNCRWCSRTYNSQSALAGHWYEKHRNKKFKCTDCHRRFSDFSALERHILSHITGGKLNKKPKKKYSCDHCQRSFIYFSNIERHMLSHTKVQPFVCQVCHKGFSLGYNLTIHMRHHTKEKPFICQFCGMAFGHKCTLQGHLKTKHQVLS